MNDQSNKFPLKESYQSAGGKKVEFEIRVIETPTGHILEAEETPESKGERFGYQFSSYASDSPYTALGDIRAKIRRKLSVKYLDYDEYGNLSLAQDELIGRIRYSAEDDAIVIEADGTKIMATDFWNILSTYEGFEIELKIKD